MTGPTEAKRAIVAAAALAGIILLVLSVGCAANNPSPALQTTRRLRCR